MPDLVDDIARIAALRGHDPQLVAKKAEELAHLSSQINETEVENLFKGHPDMLAEIDAYDGLPPASRAFIRDCHLNVSAIKWAGALLKANGREAELIELAEGRVKPRLPSEPKRRDRRAQA